MSIDSYLYCMDCKKKVETGKVRNNAHNFYDVDDVQDFLYDHQGHILVSCWEGGTIDGREI